MTQFERKQPNRVFVEAGKTAFIIGVQIQNNPYKENHFRNLWDKGWKSERRRFNDKRKRPAGKPTVAAMFKRANRER